jgi:hypothetical protein
MMENAISENLEIACPVCRARQAASNDCRRCGADLSLYSKAIRSQRAVQHAYAAAIESGDNQTAANAHQYLVWLKP